MRVRVSPNPPVQNRPRQATVRYPAKLQNGPQSSHQDAPPSERLVNEEPTLWGCHPTGRCHACNVDIPVRVRAAPPGSGPSFNGRTSPRQGEDARSIRAGSTKDHMTGGVDHGRSPDCLSGFTRVRIPSSPPSRKHGCKSRPPSHTR